MDAVEKIGRFKRFGSKLGLERMNVLLEKLGHPERALKCIHIAGTNGKGSVSRYLYSSLSACGYRCGLFTSPFLERFNERIEAEGRFISDEELDRIAGRVTAQALSMDDPPTEFEVVTCFAFIYLASLDLDFFIMETGLGGRGDSTNVIEKPLLTVITSISYDHTDRLGDTIEQIAAEKAGIIKPGVPLVANTGNEVALRVIARTCYGRGSRLIDASKYKVRVRESGLEGSRISVTIEGIRYDDVTTCMAGDFQIENLTTALAAVEELRRRGLVSLDREKFRRGIAAARQPGRFEIMAKSPYIILDGAHNPGGAEALADTVSGYFDRDRVLLVCGMLADKDIEGIVSQFVRMAGRFIVTEPLGDRRAPCEEVAEMFRKKGREAEGVKNTGEAYERAMARKHDYDCVLFAGSLYLIGDIRRRIVHEKG